VLFYPVAALAFLSAVGVVALKHPIHSAFALIGTMFFLAGIFVLLDAHFVAVIQIMVYAGAVMVLFTFVIMLLNLSPEELGPARITATKIVAVLLLVFVAYAVARGFAGGAAAPAPPADAAAGTPFGTVEQVG